MALEEYTELLDHLLSIAKRKLSRKYLLLPSAAEAITARIKTGDVSKLVDTRTSCFYIERADGVWVAFDDGVRTANGRVVGYHRYSDIFSDTARVPIAQVKEQLERAFDTKRAFRLRREVDSFDSTHEHIFDTTPRADGTSEYGIAPEIIAFYGDAEVAAADAQHLFGRGHTRGYLTTIGSQYAKDYGASFDRVTIMSAIFPADTFKGNAQYPADVACRLADTDW